MSSNLIGYLWAAPGGYMAWQARWHMKPNRDNNNGGK